jgi:charged multivesicular body protein 5
MRRVFGSKKAAAPAPSLEDASSGIGGRIGGMDKKIADLEGELRVYKDKIKKSKSPAAKKQLQKRAMEILKRKKMYEQQRDAASGQQFNIDQTSFSLESAKASIQTVAAMKAANTELKRVIKKDLDIDEVDDLADDMADMMYDFNGTCFGAGDAYDISTMFGCELAFINQSFVLTYTIGYLQLQSHQKSTRLSDETSPHQTISTRRIWMLS